MAREITITIDRYEAEMLVDLLEPLAREGHYKAQPLRDELAHLFGMSLTEKRELVALLEEKERRKRSAAGPAAP